MTIISVYGTNYFDTTGIRLESDEFELACAPLPNNFGAVDVDIIYSKYGSECHYTTDEVRHYLWHKKRYMEDKSLYNNQFHKILERKYGNDEYPDLGSDKAENFNVKNIIIPGTKIIYGQSVSSGKQRDPAKGSAAYTDEVYTSSYDKYYFIWYKTQDEVAAEINKQLKR